MTLPEQSAARAIAVCVLGLALGSLLNAEGLRKTAQTQPDGARRDLALHVTRPLVETSRFLHLTAPRRGLQAAVGREHDDEIDVRVRLTLPPPAGPVPRERTRTKGETNPTPAPAPRPRAAPPAFDAAHPLTLWVGGDSLAQVPGDALERASGSNPGLDVVAVESRLSTGLARPDLYNWYTRFGEVITRLRPKAVVLSFGADDAHDYMAGVPGDRDVGPLGSAGWVAEYRRRVEGVTREFNDAGIITVWLGLPIPDGPGFKRSFPIVNSILRSVAKAHARSRYVDTWHMLDSASGKFTPYLRVGGKLKLMRLRDGVHFTPAAGDLIAREVLHTLRSPP